MSGIVWQVFNAHKTIPLIKAVSRYPAVMAIVYRMGNDPTNSSFLKRIGKYNHEERQNHQ